MCEYPSSISASDILADKWHDYLMSCTLIDGVFYDKDGNAVDCLDPVEYDE